MAKLGSTTSNRNVPRRDVRHGDDAFDAAEVVDVGVGVNVTLDRSSPRT
jgi:hypothetical protein